MEPGVRRENSHFDVSKFTYLPARASGPIIGNPRSNDADRIHAG